MKIGTATQSIPSWSFKNLELENKEDKSKIKLNHSVLSDGK